MAAFKSQGLIEAPVAEVWRLLEDPARFPDWAADEVIEVTGVPTRIEKGSTFELKSRGPLGMTPTTVFRVEQFDELREIKLRCQTSGYYSHWLLTDARGDTFAEVEVGVEPVQSIPGRLLGALHSKGYLRRIADGSLDAIRRVFRRAPRSVAPKGRK